MRLEQLTKLKLIYLKKKIDFNNDIHQKELQYWKNIALDSKNENETKQLTDLAPLRVFFGS